MATSMEPAGGEADGVPDTCLSSLYCPIKVAEPTEREWRNAPWTSALCHKNNKSL